MIVLCYVILQPENLLLDAYGNLKISDFGLSALSQQVRVMTICFHSFFFLIILYILYCSKNPRIYEFCCQNFYPYLLLNMVYMLVGIRMMDSFIHHVELQTTLLLKSA